MLVSWGSSLGANVCPRAHVLDFCLDVFCGGSREVKYMIDLVSPRLTLEPSGPTLGHFLQYLGTRNHGDSDIETPLLEVRGIGRICRAMETHRVPFGVLWRVSCLWRLQCMCLRVCVCVCVEFTVQSTWQPWFTDRQQKRERYRYGYR